MTDNIDTTFHRMLRKNFTLLAGGKAIPLVPLNDLLLKWIMNKRNFEAGFIMLSGFNPELSARENEIALIWLKAKAVQGGYGYIPLFGEYIENKGKTDESIVRVPAIIILNTQAGGGKGFQSSAPLQAKGVELLTGLKLLGGQDFSNEGGENLSERGKDYLNVFGQDFFLYKPMGEEMVTYLYNTEGTEIQRSADINWENIGREFFSIFFQSSKFQSSPRNITLTNNLYIYKNPGDLQRAWRRYGENFYNLEAYMLTIQQNAYK